MTNSVAEKDIPEFRLVGYEIHPLEMGDDGLYRPCKYPEDAELWSIYGRLQHHPTQEESLVCIGDFHTREGAEGVVEILQSAA